MTGLTAEDHHAKEDGVWFLPVLITEFAVIFIINTITITAFARMRHMRKRSTYLIINLTVADLLVGTVVGPLVVYRLKETMEENENHSFEWPRFIVLALEMTFPISSQVNLCLISLDRLHATLFPFKHCLIRKWVYFKIIIGSWFIAFLLASLIVGLSLIGSGRGSYAWATFSILTLLVLTVSYIMIIRNVQSVPNSHHHGFIHTERKLSVTLFIVTGLSVLTILPWAIYVSIPFNIQRELSVDIHGVIIVIYISNFIVNPLVYAIRMQEFRKAILSLVCKTT